MTQVLVLRDGEFVFVEKVDHDRARIEQTFADLDYRDGVYAAADIRRARERIKRRLASSWIDGTGPRRHRLRQVEPSGVVRSAPTFDTDTVEMLIIRELAVTSPASQFGVTPTGVVFTASTFGKSREGQRLYLSGLSPLLDTIGQQFNARRGGGGGRFFESGGDVIDAADRLIIARIQVR